jgi:hypothetical protein
MGSVLMEMHEKWVTGKNSFSMERYEADKEEARKALQLDRNKLNHTDQLIAYLTHTERRIYTNIMDLTLTRGLPLKSYSHTG